MKLNHKLCLTIISIIFFFNFPGLTQQTNTNNQRENNQQKEYVIGLRKTSAPISYWDDQTGDWKGYCYALVKTLRASGFRIKIVELEIKNRFTGKGITGERLDAECGPNTKTPERDNIIKRNGLEGKFSKTFARTGAGALLLTSKMSQLISGDNLNQLTFGTIKGTTTRGIVNNVFPAFDKNKIVGLDNNQDGIKKLEDGTIDVYFNDELLLLNHLKRLNREAGYEKYSIKPGLLSTEYYGVIVYHTDENANNILLQQINDLITQASTKTLSNTTLKILENDDFQKFLQDLGEPTSDDSLSTKTQHIQNKNLENAWEWGKIFPALAVILITSGSTGIFLWTKNKEETHDQFNTSTKKHDSQDTEKSKNPLPHVSVNINNNPSNSNHTESNMAGDRNINTGGGNYNERIEGDYIQGNYYAAAEKQNLTEAAAEIQALLEQLEKSYPIDTTTGKMALATEAIQRIDSNPTLTVRILSALKVGSVKAFEQFLSHPAASFVIGALEDWEKTKGT